MNIVVAALVPAGLILLALLPRLRPSKPPLGLGLTSKPLSGRESVRQEVRAA